MSVDLDKVSAELDSLEGNMREYLRTLQPFKDKKIQTEHVIAWIENRFLVGVKNASKLLHGDTVTETSTESVPKATAARDDDESPSTVGFAEFFEMVGKSVVSAQEQLDEMSREYVDKVGEDPLVLPSMFRIPKVTADVKFALESTTQSELNLLFFGKGQSETARNQQSLKFEVVSAPPSPDVIQARNALVPRLAAVLSPGPRAELFKAIAKSSSSPSDQVKSLLLQKRNQSRVLFIPAPDSGAAGRAVFFAIALDKTADDAIYLWELSGDGAATKLVQISNFSAKKYDRIKGYLRDLLDKQEHLLKGSD